ncbi:MAG: cytochrome P450 [Deltaproteobacteria bacterium]|nr:cytochrome P450 [Deltaproteobacteria bacterium]
MREAIPVLPMADPDYWQDPYPVFRALREQHRVAQNEQGHVVPLHWQDAAWAVKGTDFIAEGIEVLERRGFKPGDPMHTWRSNAIGVMEGESHRRVRSFATGALSKRNMDSIRPLIRKHAHALLDRASGEAELDVHRDFASPLPRLVMMDFLGIGPDELSGSFAAMSRVNIVDCFGPRVTPELRTAANEAIQKSMDHVAGLYAKRRVEPRDDLLTHLVQAKDEQGALSHGELITLFSTIFGSGASTTSVLASGILELARHPEQAALFRSDPERWKRGVTEETLRFRPAIIAIGQKSAVAQTAFGIPFAKEEPIAVVLGAANRDPVRWDDPERFDIRRDPSNMSLTFGMGAHFCLGHAMARATLDEALACFIERCEEIALANEPRWIPFVMENKLDRLVIRRRTPSA